MKTTKVLFGFLILALLVLWLTGCGYRRTTIVLPDENGQQVTLAGTAGGKPVNVRGRAIIVETYGVTSESVIDVGNAADRLQYSRLCSDPENAKLDVCKTYGYDRAPSDSPKSPYGRPSGVSRRPCRYSGDYFPGVPWCDH